MRFVESFIAALRRHVAAQGQGKRPPWQLWHAIIFYTAGELTRRAIPHHVPYAVANGLWNREPWSAFRKALDAHWRPYLDGQITFDEALQRLLRAHSNGRSSPDWGCHDTLRCTHACHVLPPPAVLWTPGSP